eukprot:3485555-Pleurochrysis_carterae.AAC.1
MAAWYVPDYSVASFGPPRTYRNVGTQTGGTGAVTPSADALRMRQYRKARKLKEEQEMQI